MLLEVQDLVVSYGEVEAVHGVSFRVEEGELVSIIGANGAGKSSILRTLMGLQAPTSGAVRFLGEDVTGEPAHIRARRGIRMVPERARVFPQLTVKENLLMGVYGLRKALPYEERLRWLYGLFPILEERGGSSPAPFRGGNSSSWPSPGLSSRTPNSCWWTRSPWDSCPNWWTRCSRSFNN